MKKNSAQQNAPDFLNLQPIEQFQMGQAITPAQPDGIDDAPC